MPIDPQWLSHVIFGPVSLYDGNRGDDIYQTIALERESGPELNEGACAVMTDAIVHNLRMAARGDAQYIGLLRELAECADDRRTQISERYDPILNTLVFCNFVDKERKLSNKAIGALKFALLETGIADLPEYKKIVTTNETISPVVPSFPGPS